MSKPGDSNIDLRLVEVRNGITFAQCLEVCMYNSDFVAEWERLSGKQLFSRDPLARMIDEATGYDLAIIREFADFVYATVFCTFRTQQGG